jgi:hypothetical protein
MPRASSSASSTSDQNAALAWTANGGMIEARFGHTATLLVDGNVLVAGGFSGGGTLASAELYDPSSRSWTATGTMIEARVGHTATLLADGRVLVAGGSSSGSSSDPLASAELYDPSSGSWTATGAMIDARVGPTATLLPDGKVLVAGGGYGSLTSDTLASAELYDPGSGSWTATGSMAGVRGSHTATLLTNGKVLVAGDVSDFFGPAELYDPGSGTWTATGGMIQARYGHTATLLPDGKVLVAGSDIGIGPLASAELYDPGTGSWTATGGMIEARYGHTATPLPDGTVLVAGGTNSGGWLASAELYDPGTGSWTATGGMLEARSGHTATLLPDGTVLVAGGTINFGGDALGSAELFDPSIGIPDTAMSPARTNSSIHDNVRHWSPTGCH